MRNRGLFIAVALLAATPGLVLAEQHRQSSPPASIRHTEAIPLRPMPASLEQPENSISADQLAETCSQCAAVDFAVRCHGHGCDWLGAFRPPNAELYRNRPFDYRHVFDYPWRTRPRPCIGAELVPLAPLARGVPQATGPVHAARIANRSGRNKPPTKRPPAKVRLQPELQLAPLPEQLLTGRRVPGGASHGE